MFRCDILQTRRAHRTGTQHHLARPRVKSLQELDDATHRVRRERGQVHNYPEVVRKEDEYLESRADRKEVPLLDLEVLARPV